MPAILLAGFDSQELTFSIGMVNASYKENASSLSSTSSTSNVSTPSSGAASILPVDIIWEFYQNQKNSYFARTTAPLLITGKDSYFSLGGGANFYFKSLSNQGTFKDQNDEIYIKPKMRYYWGGGVNAGYLIYSTKTAKKSDIVLDLGLHTGLVYSVNSIWGLRAEAGYARAIGVLTSSSIVRAFIGLTHDVNTFF